MPCVMLITYAKLKALVEIEKEEWARRMQRLLRRACHVTNRARERGVPIKPRLIDCFERRYDAILAEGLVFHEAQAPLVRAAIKGGGKRRGRAPRRTGHNLLLRLAAFGEALLWSLERHFGAAFTPELREAWRALYATVQAEMLRAGMRESNGSKH
jgi:hypothetical protein